ncbi:ribonuclease VapC [Desulfosarcina widdelii]|uniref:Ribonuclease VapC n=1 Tax=Desulfosarcina widdelii TaxID=947919 RepID=A0A5K7Z8K8_9BACT|nr:type II toxin-antitoxin system VapC family toxin [Desulfosarcina widdelii]BBO72807.1 ribonuclease VapC [Desulfosarcina widdelii]
MFLLDTNVLSELMRPMPDPRVVQWIDRIPEWDLWISTITVAEIHLNIALLDDGQRKRKLGDLAEQMFREDFEGRILPFDYHAATEYAKVVVHRSRIGRPISVEDAQIAAIARTADLSIATRNTKDFHDIQGIDLSNPWI